jgi:hypothetical protein
MGYGASGRGKKLYWYEMFSIYDLGVRASCSLVTVREQDAHTTV